MAEAYLAFIALDRGNPAEARAMAQRVREGPSGNTRDLGTLIDGASLAREGKPEKALQLLDPLVGRMIDSFAQDLLHGRQVGAGPASDQEVHWRPRGGSSFRDAAGNATVVSESCSGPSMAWTTMAAYGGVAMPNHADAKPCRIERSPGAHA